MNLNEHILQIQNDLRAGRFLNEASVSQGVVLRILQILGWPIFDSHVVMPEYSVGGRRVDFALCHPARKPLIFIEVKQVGQSEGADKQLFEYAFHEGVPLTVLTDGQEWHFYLPAEQGSYQERRVYKLDILERNIDECAYRFKRYLDYNDSCSGKTLQEARKEYQSVSKERQINQTLPIAWEKLIKEPDEILLELVADKVESICGYKPDLDSVSSFLTNKTTKSILPSHTTNHILPAKPNVIQINTSTNNELPFVGFSLNGFTHKARNGRSVMTQIFQELSKLDPTFLERFDSRPHGKKRRFIARSKNDLYPDRPDLCESASYPINNDWWMGVNYSKMSMEKIIKMACEVAGLKFGSDVIIRLD